MFDKDTLKKDSVSEEKRSRTRSKQWLMPVLDSLIALGGQAPRPDVHKIIIETYGITEQQLEKKHKSGNSVILNDIDFARNYLNYEGFLDSTSEWGIWKISEIGRRILITDDFADKLYSKWNKITEAKRNNKPIPDIDISSFYQYRNRFELYHKEDFFAGSIY